MEINQMKLQLKKLSRTLKSMLTSLFAIVEIILDKGMYRVPLLVKLKMNLKGFVADRYVIYNIKSNNIDNYISDFEVFLSKRINRQYCLLMDDKFLLSSIFGKYVNVPRNFVIIKNGHLFDIYNSKVTFADFLRLFITEKQLIIKPIDGGGGKNIHIISTYKKIDDEKTDQREEIGIFLDNKYVTQDDLFAWTKTLDHYIVTEYVKQHHYANELYKFTANTIRIITIQDPYQSKIRIPIAVQRIGRNASFPVDNFDKGGISVEIDLETGILGRAASRLSCTTNSPIFFDKHPDTGAQISGVTIPFWKELKNNLIEVASSFPFIAFIAWDVAITETGFTVIELNKSSGCKLYQVFGGQKKNLLGDFYRYHGIIR
jgi:hypothetical protein